MARSRPGKVVQAPRRILRQPKRPNIATNAGIPAPATGPGTAVTVGVRVALRSTSPVLFVVPEKMSKAKNAASLPPIDVWKSVKSRPAAVIAHHEPL